MTTPSNPAAVPLTVRIGRHLRTPLYQNAYNLMLSTGAASALGLLYWMVAARYYSVEAVGLNAAAISMMTFLSGVAQLNLMSAMIRFIPQAGRATRRLVLGGYAVSGLLSILVGVIFILGIGLWAPKLAFLAETPAFALWFILGIVAWSLFALQDNVLTGLRRTAYVPLENIAYAVGKIALLILLAGTLSRYGILASWTFPLLLALLPINLLIFMRLIPRHQREMADRAQPLVPRQIARYVTGNYVGSLFTWAYKGLLPLIVLQQVGAGANAYFYLPFSIVIGLKLLMFNMGMSLTVEGALDETRLAAHSRRFMVHMARLIIPAVILIEIVAPYVLELSGRAYAAEGTTLLRIMVLVAIPNIVNALFISWARVRRQIRGIVLVQGALALLGLGLSFVLLPLYGINGVGIALLASETLVALGVLIFYLGPVLRTGPVTVEPEGVDA